jgi:hypothetical protein
VKHTYRLRNNVWQDIVELVRLLVRSLEVAIDCIYLVYSAQTSVTKILTSLRTRRIGD